MFRCCEYNVTTDSVKNSAAAPTSLSALSRTEDCRVEFQSQLGEKSPHKTPYHMRLWLGLSWGYRKGIEGQIVLGVFARLY